MRVVTPSSRPVTPVTAIVDLIKTDEAETQPNNSKCKPGSAERDDASQHSKVSRSHDSAFKRVRAYGKSSEAKNNNVTDQVTTGRADPNPNTNA